MICTSDDLLDHSASMIGGMTGVANHGESPAERAGCDEALADDLGWGLGVVFRAYVAAAHGAMVELPGGPRGYQVLAASAHSAVVSQAA
jgi:hypothetical protein